MSGGSCGEVSDWLSYLQHPGSEFHSRRTGGRDEETYPELYRRLSAGRETGDWWVWLSGKWAWLWGS